MDAEEIIAVADAMQAYARESGRDLNAANLFVHEILMRALNAERQAAEQRAFQVCDAA